MAASGWLSLSPGALDDPSLPPLKPFGQQAHFQAGIHGAIATLGALAARERTGAGQHVDISVQAAIASQIENGLTHYTYLARVASRLGSRILGPWGTLRLSDGTLFVACITEDEWRRFVAFLGTPEWTESPIFADRLVRAEHQDALLSLLESELGDRNVFETYLALQSRRVPCAPILEMADLLRNEHLEARGFFVQGDHPQAGRWTFPGALAKFSKTPWQPGRPAPLLGEHSAEVATAWSGRTSALRFEDSCSVPTLPLAGLRVLDFTWAWAGPTCTLQLAHLGAEVIRVESSTRLDTVRGLPPFWGDQGGPNRSGYFNQYSQGKRSLTLNLKQPEARDLAYALAATADVVVDNFSAGAIERMGFGYQKLHAIRPDIVQISLSGHGQTGPISHFIAYGPTQVPMTGLLSLTGYLGDRPREVGISYGDPNGGINAALAVLAALHHRRRTGEGQYIDLSQWEVAIPLVIEGLMTYQMTGKQPPRMGNRDEFEAPQGVFRCLGEDDWLAVSCWSYAEWRALAEVIGRTDLRDEPGLNGRTGRKAREAELEQAIADWTAQHTREEASSILRAAGIPAYPVYTTLDLTADPELHLRGFWVELPHAECGRVVHAGIPWSFDGTPLRVRSAAPLLGEHTEDILRDELGLSEERVHRLRESGALD